MIRYPIAVQSGSEEVYTSAILIIVMIMGVCVDNEYMEQTPVEYVVVEEGRVVKHVLMGTTTKCTELLL